MSVNTAPRGRTPATPPFNLEEAHTMMVRANAGLRGFTAMIGEMPTLGNLDPAQIEALLMPISSYLDGAIDEVDAACRVCGKEGEHANQ